MFLRLFPTRSDTQTAVQDAGAALGLQHTCMAQAPSHPKHPAATSTMRLNLAATGRALEHDRMIRACLERRHHLQRNDFPHLCQNVQQPSWNVMGKSEAVRQGKVFPHKIGVVALFQRREKQDGGSLDYA